MSTIRNKIKIQLFQIKIVFFYVNDPNVSLPQGKPSSGEYHDDNVMNSSLFTKPLKMLPTMVETVS